MARGKLAEQHGDRRALVGHDELAGDEGGRARVAAQPLPAPGHPDAQRTLDGGGVERPDRHPGLHQRDQQRVVEEVVGPKGPLDEPLHRGLLDRRAVGVGVQADVAVEDAVGPGNRLLAHGHGLGAAKAAGHVAQPLLDAARAAPGPGRDLQVAQAQRGKLLGDLSRHAAGGELGLQLGRAHRGGLQPRRSAAASSPRTRAANLASPR